MRIRAATAADLDTIDRLIRALAEYERLVHEVKMDKEQLGQYLFGERKYAEVLIAENEDGPCGFALFFHNFSTFLGRPGIYLEDLFVLPDRRSEGIGKALLKRLAEIAVERRCGRLEWAVLDWNTDAIGFYERLGAHPNADWTIYRLTGGALEKLASG
jgi:GNAT superfamily N-acetyltransferase